MEATTEVLEAEVSAKARSEVPNVAKVKQKVRKVPGVKRVSAQINQWEAQEVRSLFQRTCMTNTEPISW